MLDQYYCDYLENEITKRMDPSKNYTDREFAELVSYCADLLIRKTGLPREQADGLCETVFNSRRKLGILQPLLDDPEVNEIMINGTESIYVERAGRMERCEQRYRDAGMLFNVIQSMVSWVDRTVNESNPIVDTRLQDGSRVNIVLKPVALNGPIVTVRKFPDRIFTMEDLLEEGSVTREEAELLTECVAAGVNIFVSGGTSSGKTTFLNVLCGFVPEEERIVTVEDSAELRLSPPNIVRLETRPGGPDGGGISMRDLIKASLRMRPDRIIVGEVRDRAALDMLQAMCTGHEGCMSTAHANSSEDVITRLETMALWDGTVNSEAVRKQIASGLDLIVHMERDASMKRRVAEISAVTGFREGKVQLLRLFYRGTRENSLAEGMRAYEKIAWTKKRKEEAVLQSPDSGVGGGGAA